MRPADPLTSVYVESKDVSLVTDSLGKYTPYEKRITYFNHTNVDITVCERSGLPVRIPPSGQRTGEFIIQVGYTFDAKTLIDPDNSFNSYSTESAEAKVLREGIALVDKQRQFMRNFSTAYRYHQDQIHSLGGVLYIVEHDIIVSSVSDGEQYTHPYSDTATRFQYIAAETDPSVSDSLNYSMYLVSNDGAVRDKYVNIMGDVYRIPSIRNLSKREGIYVCNSGTIHATHARAVPVSRFYTFDDAKEVLRLYDDPETARVHGDEQNALKIELEKQQQSLKQREHEFKMEKLEYEQELVRLKRQSELQSEWLKETKTMAELQREHQKDKTEDDSRRRKLLYDWLKISPQIILAGLTLITLLAKLKEKG